MDRNIFISPALDVAPRLLGSLLTVHTPQEIEGRVADKDFRAGRVTIRITEVEAYHGVGTPGPYDAGSHARSRRTERNASMFGPPGHAYVYFSYGMHFALNLVCSPEGAASGVLLRAGEIVDGADLAQLRRRRVDPRHGSSRKPIPPERLARGPGNLARALGITRQLHDGRDLFTAPFEMRFPAQPGEAERPGARILRGPRVGVSGEAGGCAFPWRFWLENEPSVSAYRPGRNVPRGIPEEETDQGK